MKNSSHMLSSSWLLVEAIPSLSVTLVTPESKIHSCSAVHPDMRYPPSDDERCLQLSVILVDFYFCKNGHAVLTDGAKLLIRFLSWWRGSLRFVSSPVTCNKGKTRRGLAGGASSDAQVSRENKRVIILFFLYLLDDRYIYRLHFTIDA